MIKASFHSEQQQTDLIESTNSKENSGSKPKNFDLTLEHSKTVYVQGLQVPNKFDSGVQSENMNDPYSNCSTPRKKTKSILKEELEFFVKVLKSYDMKIMMPQILWSGASKAYWIGLLTPIMWIQFTN